MVWCPGRNHTLKIKAKPRSFQKHKISCPLLKSKDSCTKIVHAHQIKTNPKILLICQHPSKFCKTGLVSNELSTDLFLATTPMVSHAFVPFGTSRFGLTTLKASTPKIFSLGELLKSRRASWTFLMTWACSR